MNRPKGTKDIFGDRKLVRNKVIDILKLSARIYNFKEIETPIFERQEVFVKSVGETSDIVSKEMYAFKDKKNRDMVLRPEGTAGTIRAYVENKLFADPNMQKLFYLGPMFRYENPQKGRQRQFTQFGVEIFGEKNPYIDSEVILMAKFILDALGLKYELLINSLGDKESRDNYSKALKKYFEKYKDELSKDSLERLESNPMRILDDKIDGKKNFVKQAPKISEFYSEEIKKYFNSLTQFLDNMKINYKIDTNLVRGLDYYTDTAFEFVSKSDAAGSQSTLIGGGRYENLVKQFGGPNISGIGFGLGIERIVNDVENTISKEEFKNPIHAYVLNISEEAQGATAGVVQLLRSAGFVTEWNSKPLKLQKAFVKAEKSLAIFNIIAGAKELSEGKIVVKHNGKQETIEITKLIDYLSNKVDNNHKGNKNEKN